MSPSSLPLFRFPDDEDPALFLDDEGRPRDLSGHRISLRPGSVPPVLYANVPVKLRVILYHGVLVTLMPHD